MIQQIHKSYALTTSWLQIEPNDAARAGVMLQNHSANTDNILISQGEQNDDFSAVELVPGTGLYEDIIPPSGAIWAKSAAGAPTLTLILKY